MESSTTVVEKRRTGLVTYTVTRKPTSLSEMRMRRDRWFDYAVDHITECYEVTVKTVAEGFNTETETFFEFVTPYGRGCVINYREAGGEIEVFIPNSGKALLHGFWTKRGKKVGWASAYVHGNKVNPNNSKKVDHTCPARIYAALAGKKFGYE